MLIIHIIMEVYVVTEFGCNSTPSDMYPPSTWVFTDREKAYQCYHDHAPSLTDIENMAERTILKSGECIIQLCGYPYEDNRAKRPYGVSITKEKIM
jgi:hypothetical protein